MIKNVIQFIVMAVVLVLVQIIFNKILLFGVAVPLVYVYLLLRLPIGMRAGSVYSIAFFLGLIIDIFNNTQGMNAMACLIMASVREPVFNAVVTRGDDSNLIMPSMGALGAATYLKYMVMLVLVFCVVLFAIQAFTLHDLALTLARIVCSTILSAVLLFGIDSMMSTQHDDWR